jgi:hypothetical protein
MAGTAPARDDRIELRATYEEKRLIAEAAAREQLDVSASSCEAFSRLRERSCGGLSESFCQSATRSAYLNCWRSRPGQPRR